MMVKTLYGQYCPVAQALELIGERWTLLIIRDMLSGTKHFSDLKRGLPGIPKALLAKRLKQLEQYHIIEKQLTDSGRKTTVYHLTQAGLDLYPVINSLLSWGAMWAFGDPTPEQLDPLLLIWWMHERINREAMPDQILSLQFNFYGAKTDTYWLVIKPDDVNICVSDPGYEINLLITADLATFFKLWLGRVEYDEILQSDNLRVDGIPEYVRAFPTWFMWSLAAPAVRAVTNNTKS